jgi:hypothetical protein
MRRLEIHRTRELLFPSAGTRAANSDTFNVEHLAFVVWEISPMDGRLCRLTWRDAS